MGAHWEWKLAARSLARNPGFTAVAVATLALGIGANTAVFSVADGLLLKPLAFPEPDQIIQLQTERTSTGRRTPRVTGGDWQDLRNLPEFAASSLSYGGDVGVQAGNRSEFAGAYFVNPPFFSVVGRRFAAGRAFTEAEEGRGAVISAPFAQEMFGGAAQALGQKLRVEDRLYDVTGVLEPGAVYPPRAALWLAAPNVPANLNRTAFNYVAFARLREGTGLTGVQSKLDALSATLEKEHPGSNKAKRIVAVPLRESLTGSARGTVLLLAGAVGLVLLIACANLANLLLARSADRTREMAMRAAMGASRRQLVALVLGESVWLGVLGGVTGLLLAWLSLDVLLALAPADLPRLGEVHLDARVLLFTLLACGVSVVLFGLAPALRATRVDMAEALKTSGSRGSLAGGSARLQRGLVVAEVAVSLALVLGAGLLFRSFAGMLNADLGFRTGHLLVVEAHDPASGLEGYLRSTDRIAGLLEELRAFPGVTHAAAAMGLPLGRYGSNGAYQVEGQPMLDDWQLMPQAGFRLASPGYFAAMGIPLRQGRDFTNGDRYDSDFVAVINESLARQSFPGQDPIGRRLRCGLDSPNWMRIVGVVGDTRQDSPGLPPGPELYMPLRQHPYHANEVHVVVRSAQSPESLRKSVEAHLRSRYPQVAARYFPMESLLQQSLAAPRFRTWVVGLFGGLALLMAMAGVYGVISYLVSRRMPEIGLRMALGAARGSVFRLVLGGSLRLAVWGLLAGSVLAYWLARTAQSLIAGLSPSDPLAWALAGAAILTATALAAVSPAWRAARADPMKAMRQE
jgi:predicted permease